MTPERIAVAARALVAARRSGQRLDRLPEGARPADVDEAHAIQEATTVALGETVAGWKVLPPIDGRLPRGVLLGSRVFASPAAIPAREVALLGVEAEIAFRFERDLAPRPGGYAYEEVAGAVTAMAALEIVDSRFRDYGATPVLERLADFASNGALVHGALQPRWRAFDLASISVELAIDERPIVRQSGGHAARDPLLPAVALANDLTRSRTIRQGQVVTTGTYTGLNFAKPGQVVTATFAGFGVAQVRFPT